MSEPKEFKADQKTNPIKYTGIELLQDLTRGSSIKEGFSQFYSNLCKVDNFADFWLDSIEIARVIGHTQATHEFNAYLIGTLAALKLVGGPNTMQINGMRDALGELYTTAHDGTALPSVPLIAQMGYEGYAYTTQRVEDDADFDTRIVSQLGFTLNRDTLLMFQSGLGITMYAYTRAEQTILKKLAENTGDLDDELASLLEDGGGLL